MWNYADDPTFHACGMDLNNLVRRWILPTCLDVLWKEVK